MYRRPACYVHVAVRIPISLMGFIVTLTVVLSIKHVRTPSIFMSTLFKLKKEKLLEENLRLCGDNIRQA